MNIYTIVFNDNSVYNGGDLNSPKWLEVPHKKIRTIFYSLPLGDNLVLSGADKYYHFIEATEDLTGDKKGQKQLEYAYLIGKKGNQYKLYKVNLRTGQIEIQILDENNEIIKQLNPIGWR